jgi:DNA-binding cell septation regulator SpoVG
MNIENFRQLNVPGKVLAVFDLRLKNGILYRGMKVIEGKGGSFVSFQSIKDAEGKWVSVVEYPAYSHKAFLMEVTEALKAQGKIAVKQPDTDVAKMAQEAFNEF